MANTLKPQSVQTKVTESTDGSVRIVQPKGRRHHGVTVLLEPDDLVREQVGGFLRFLREHAVVGVAIGFIIGLQAQTLVKQLVTSFITPMLNLLVGKNLQHKQLVLHRSNPVVFAWGEFVYTLADFLVVLLVIYLIVKFLRLDKLDKK